MQVFLQIQFADIKQQSNMKQQFWPSISTECKYLVQTERKTEEVLNVHILDNFWLNWDFIKIEISTKTVTFELFEILQYYCLIYYATDLGKNYIEYNEVRKKKQSVFI